MLKTARKNMVNCQLRPNKIVDPAVLAAMAHVPREAFLPPHLRHMAYSDCDIALSPTRWMSAPLTVATMLQGLEISTSDRVLIVGVSSGYLAAVAAQLSDNVVGLESDSAMADMAADYLEQYEPGSVTLSRGPLAEGVAELAPFDAIAIDSVIAEVPPALHQQLNEAGRMVYGWMAGGMARIAIAKKWGAQLSPCHYIDHSVPSYPEFRKAGGFQFQG